MPQIRQSNRELLRTLPDQPGIYVFRDESGRVLYVGKAKSLRKRVASYFQKGSPRDGNLRIATMVKRIHDFDFVTTASESEALLLEANFIKHHRPLYNIDLRDDKSYPYVAVTLDEEFPRVIVTRKPHRPGVAYFGPFANAGMVRDTIEMLGRIFPFRKCRGASPGRHTGAPCLNYHIGLCLAPCDGKVDAVEYRAMINRVVRLLSGQPEGLVESMREAMDRAAAGQRYEEAAVLRDRLRALEHLMEKQQASATGLASADVLGIHAEGEFANVQVLQVRDGMLSDRQSVFLKNAGGETDTFILEQFILRYYATPVGLPSEIVVPSGFTKAEMIAEFLSGQKGTRVQVRAAVRGKRRELAAMADRNAALAFEQDRLREREKQARPARALAELKEVLGLPGTPSRIECFDISNIGGAYPVGSMVVFENGRPAPDQYRKFAVRREPGPPDDFAMMAEVVGRRFARLAGNGSPGDSSFSRQPDLVVVDGGAGQVSAAAGMLEIRGIEGMPVIGLAKRFEEIYLPYRKEPLRLSVGSDALGLLKSLRDEAHRFAVSFHRQRRDRQVSSSILDGIPGIGPARKHAILKRFGSPERFLEASRDELEAVPGLPAKVARDVYAYIHKLGKD
ncbi:MAG: excinuclease ABC subunit UvrC [Gaiellales bacterium]|nr:MAG: excinuclease ABC subunit UvrC [Gaiellales bacterium]